MRAPRSSGHTSRVCARTCSKSAGGNSREGGRITFAIIPPMTEDRPTSSSRKTISILTACFNEEDNVEELYDRVRAAMAKVGRYDYEHIFIDNCSSDRTVEILKGIA